MTEVFGSNSPSPSGADLPAGEEEAGPPYPRGEQHSGGGPSGGPAYWPPPPGGPWWGTPPWGPPASARPSRSRSHLRLVALAAALVGAVGAGIGIGYVLGPSTPSDLASGVAPGSSSGGSGDGNPFSGSDYNNPFSGSGADNPFSGSGGSGSLGGDSTPGTSTNGGGSSDVSSIAAEVDPALVDINVIFDGDVSGAGTGIVLNSDGEVLTNNHVVEGATSISVTDIGNGKTYGATVVGYDSSDDVAVIQLTDASGLQAAHIGNPSNVAVGDAVVAIGNAGGTGGTPTATGGSITALNQAITASDEVSGGSESLSGLIETDADIQPGDSGGSLVNSSGQVIGMDTAASEGYSLSSQADQGYAIPIDKALSVASQIEAGDGSSTVHVGPTAYLGVLVSTSNSSASAYPGGYYSPFGAQNGTSNSDGALVSAVVSGGPASEIGLTQGDVITSLGGHSVTSASDLTALIQQYQPGDSVQVGWTDTSGEAHTATATLGSGPAQ